jgi:RHS repeat-associated protein
VVSKAGQVIESTLRYKPWGEQRLLTGLPRTQRRYTGQVDQNDAFVGSIIDYGARFYSPWLGRFVSADTIIPGGKNPQAFNRYSYVLSRPLNYIDPSGHSQDEFSDQNSVRQIVDLDEQGEFYWSDVYDKGLEVSGELKGTFVLIHYLENNPAYNTQADRYLREDQIAPVVMAQLQASLNRGERLSKKEALGIVALLGTVFLGADDAGNRDSGKRGGVYTLRDPDNLDDVYYVGQTKNLDSRSKNHAKDPKRVSPNGKPLVFTEEEVIDDYATRRGIEQRIYERYLPSGRLQNRNRPIGPNNPKRRKYLEAAGKYYKKK